MHNGICESCISKLPTDTNSYSIKLKVEEDFKIGDFSWKRGDICSIESETTYQRTRHLVVCNPNNPSVTTLCGKEQLFSVVTNI